MAGSQRRQEGSQQSGENPNGGRTPGTENGPDVAGNGLDESEESEEERLARLEQNARNGLRSTAGRGDAIAERMDQIKIKRRQKKTYEPPTLMLASDLPLYEQYDP